MFNKLAKWFECTFIDKCRSKSKWKMTEIYYDGDIKAKCTECGKCKRVRGI